MGILIAVSYTHLDVYKRQILYIIMIKIIYIFFFFYLLFLISKNYIIYIYIKFYK